MRKPSFEGVVRVLQQGTEESDVELAFRLGCKRGMVEQARAALGMPPRPLPVIRPGMSDEQRVMLGSVLTSGGHRRWTGRVTDDGVPVLDNRKTVARVVFRMTYGREPEGQVRVTCVRKHCTEGSHLADRAMREGRTVEAPQDAVGGAR